MNENVLGLQISMPNAVLVKVLKRLRKASEEALQNRPISPERSKQVSKYLERSISATGYMIRLK